MMKVETNEIPKFSQNSVAGNLHVILFPARFIRTLQTWSVKMKYSIYSLERGNIAALVASHALCASFGLACTSLRVASVYNNDNGNDFDVTERPIQSCSTPGSKATTKSNVLSQVNTLRAC